MKNTKSITVTMIVRLIDGTIHRFKFTDGGDDVMLASRLEKVLETHALVLELGDRLLVIPKQSILSVELTPAPPKLPGVAIRNAQVIE